MPDLHGAFSAPTDEEIAAMEPRIKAFIFPNIPRKDYEIEAFDSAVVYQIAHEKSIAAAMQGQQIPQGTRSFSIGNFSMSFGDNSFDGMLTKRNICPTAYGILLEAGLLYKGVERGGCCYVPD